jgi:hypothetical protein
MEAVVTPRMQEIFVDFDPHRYAGMGGSGLTALSPRGRAAAERMHRLMVDRVAPEMARLLGRAATDYDCFECHAADR